MRTTALRVTAAAALVAAGSLFVAAPAQAGTWDQTGNVIDVTGRGFSDCNTTTDSLAKDLRAQGSQISVTDCHQLKGAAGAAGAWGATITIR